MIDRTVSTRTAPPKDAEHEALAALAAAVQAAGLEAERGAVVNLYVGLKSKPLTLLVGPEHAGKVAAMRCLADVLTGGDPLRAQFMPGHAWWAGQTGNVAPYTHAQTRLNTCKLLDVLEEAHAPESQERVLLACLTRISPAELMTFFSATAFQLQHGELMRLFGAHFTEPVPYPRNLLLAGTLDAGYAHDLDAETWAMTNVVEWPASGQVPADDAPRPAPPRDYGPEFLASMVRTEAEARLKLRRVLHQSLAALQPLACLEEAVQLPAGHRWPALRAELLVYLANAFSRTGPGLFDERPLANVELALDWAIATRLLPRFRGPLGHTPALQPALQRFCAGRWPKAAQALEALPARV
jgi:hypothetical protein